MDEHSDDVKAAKKMEFGSSGSAQERRRKRLEIATQSVFDQPSDEGGGDKTGTKKARALLLAARSKTKGGAFSSPSSASSSRTGRRTGVVRTGVVRTDRLRDSLGIKTLGKNIST